MYDHFTYKYKHTIIGIQKKLSSGNSLIISTYFEGIH